jgi:peptide/nickel transport system permease protein
MGTYIARRLTSMVLVLAIVSLLTFLIFDAIPNGNPALRMAGRTATPTEIAAVEQTYGFNKPIYVQYLRTMDQIFTGRIISYAQHVNVLDQIRADLPVTASLVLGAFVIWIILGLLLGLTGGYRAGGKVDTLITVVNFGGISAPVFVVGYLMIYLLSFRIHLFPASGYAGLSDPLSWADHLIMPWFSLAISYVGVYAQVLRASVVDTLNEDFVRTARAKGLSGRRVAVRHVLRASLMSIVALSGLDLAAVLGGSAILTETVFNLPGIGNYAGQSIGALDEPPIMVITLFGAFAVVLLSAIADVVYVMLDPRIRMARS